MRPAAVGRFRGSTVEQSTAPDAARAGGRGVGNPVVISAVADLCGARLSKRSLF
jgi:hypothetical protein